MLLGDSSFVCCLSSCTCTNSPVLHFFSPLDINTSTLNMHARPLMFMFLSWRHSSVGLAIFSSWFPLDRNPQLPIPAGVSSFLLRFQIAVSQSIHLQLLFGLCCFTQARPWHTHAHIHTYAQTQWEAGNALLIWAQCESHVREDSCASL